MFFSSDVSFSVWRCPSLLCAYARACLGFLRRALHSDNTAESTGSAPGPTNTQRSKRSITAVWLNIFSDSTRRRPTDLHEVVCDVFWLQTRDSLRGGLRHVNPEVSGLQPAEVCKQVSGLPVQRWGGTGQHLEGEITGNNLEFLSTSASHNTFKQLEPLPRPTAASA